MERLMELRSSLTAEAERKSELSTDGSLTDIIFSWSLKDVANEKLYARKVAKIPDTFGSMEDYFGYFVFPLLEETRTGLWSSMEVISNAPFSRVVSLEECKPYGSLLYNVNVEAWMNRSHGKDIYSTLPGDILVVSDRKPKTVSDLQRAQVTWNFAFVTKIPDDDDADAVKASPTSFMLKASKEIEVEGIRQKRLYLLFLINISTSNRILKALRTRLNLDIIKYVLRKDMDKTSCCHCSSKETIPIMRPTIMSELNESQSQAVLASLRNIRCDHNFTIDLIWGPPGTGKTKTTSLMLFHLLKLGRRTLTCAPTNIAITELVSRVYNVVKHACKAKDKFTLGDIVLFGNKERLKVGPGVEEIYLDFRIKRLAECLMPLTGWRHCFTSMLDFLEDCVSQYHIFLENEEIMAKVRNGNETPEKEFKSFLEFARKRFKAHALPVKTCISVLCTHIPKSYIMKHNFDKLVKLANSLDQFEMLIGRNTFMLEDLEEIFSCPKEPDESCQFMDIFKTLVFYTRASCICLLRTLRKSLNDISLPSALSKDALSDFCLQNATLIFSTVSSSYKLHSVEMEPLDLLVIDEAAQLKECESVIPLQLPSIRHAILIGDECQLPAVIMSKLSAKAGFGRSLFERLSFLGHKKHLLNVQYRMHPSINFFPNSRFYSNQIINSESVKNKSFERHYLQGPMFGPYSFINIMGGKEESDDFGHSKMNIVEASVAAKLVQKLHKSWTGNGHKLTVGVVSPYAAQVTAIQEKLGRIYGNVDNFSVKVKSVDGFQGGEEDVIIISTVRCNSGGHIGFVSDHRRTNVALTRARHCLWILGSERTLLNSDSIWQDLVCDAKSRKCFFNASMDNDISKAMRDVKEEFDRLNELLIGESAFFKAPIWKVQFSEDFKKSFSRLMSVKKKTSVTNLILRLASGWRPKLKAMDTVSDCSYQMLRQFKVDGLYVMCSIDIVKDMGYTQVLKVWDILPLEQTQKLVENLDHIFGKYSDDFIRLCTKKSYQGDLEVPKIWPPSFGIIRFKGEIEEKQQMTDKFSFSKKVGPYKKDRQNQVWMEKNGTL